MKARSELAAGLLAACLIWSGHGCSRGEEQEQGKTTVEFEPEETTLILLDDKRCTDRRCRTEPVVKKLKESLGNLHVVRHDWSSEECKRIFKREGLRHLPSFLFDGSVEQNAGYAKIKRYLVPTPGGRMKKLKYPTKFDPRAEICDNGLDDTGNGKVDCDDLACKGNVVCRDDKPRRLEVFVMSQCPYGTRALDSVEELLDAFERKIDFRVHYIASEKNGKFKSLHGQDEVDENIRELCAIKHYPKGYRYMKYIWCRNRKIKDKNWKACTGANGIKAEVIEKCASGEEGKELLGNDIKLAKSLGVTASPMWLANNRFLFHGIAPESIKQEFCKRNKGLKGCEKKLSSASPVPANAVCK